MRQLVRFHRLPAVLLALGLLGALVLSLSDPPAESDDAETTEVEGNPMTVERQEIAESHLAGLEVPAGDPTQSETAKRFLTGAGERAGQMSGGERHELILPLQADQYVEVAVRQIGIDVWLELFGPQGELLAREDSPTGDQCSEALLVVAGQAGEHLLRINAFGSPEKFGRFVARVRESRTPATASDHRRVAGSRSFAKGYRFFEQQETSAALEQYRNALGHFEAAGDSGRIAKAWHGIGWMHDELGEKEEALGPYRRALELFRQLEDAYLQAVIHNSLGRIQQSQGQRLEAADSYRRAAELFQQAGDRSGEGNALNNLGVTLRLAGQVQGALESYRKALTIWTELGVARDEAKALGNLGKLYLALGKTQEAHDFFLRGLRLAEENEDRRNQAIARNGLADVHHRQGAYPEALENLDLALAVWRQLKDRRRQGITLNSLGTTRLKAGQPEQARECYEEALRLFRQLDDVANQAITLLNMGRYHYDRRDFGLAAEVHREALPLYRQAGNRSGQASTLFAEARALHAMGRLEPALRGIESALNLVESLRTEPEGHDFRTAYFATKQQYWELSIEILMGLDAGRPGEGFAARALEASERRRSRSLLDLLGEANADIRRGVSPEWLRREEDIRRQLNALELRRMELDEAGPEIQSAIRVEQRILATELEQMRVKIRRQSPRYAELTETEPVTLETIQERLLDRETQLLIYSLGQQRSFLWLVSKRDVVAMALPPRQHIEAGAEELYQQMLRFNEHARRTRRQVAAELSETILGPIADRLTAQRLLVVSDGALQYIPFAALPVPRQSAADGRSRYLIENHEIVSLPSASTLAVLRTRQHDPVEGPLRLAVIADPVYGADDPRFFVAGDEGNESRNEPSPTDNEAHVLARDAGLSPLRRLPFSGQEAESLLELVPEEQRLAAVGLEASRARVVGGELEDYRILHFATHGLLNRRQPDLSGLVLSLVDERGEPQDGFLRLHDIYNLRLRADLVVLSACQTGLGQEVRGEGLIGLTRGFMFAGAPRVVVSLWSVSDRSTAELMRRFYTGLLREEKSYPGALREAQLSMLREEAWQDPYHWAGFIFQGDWRGLARDGEIGEQHTGGGEEDPSSDEDLPIPFDPRSEQDPRSASGRAALDKGGAS